MMYLSSTCDYISSVPIFDLAKANTELADLSTEHYFIPAAGRVLLERVPLDSFSKSGNMGKCPFYKAEKEWAKQMENKLKN
jgi:hypothetical protein